MPSASRTIASEPDRRFGVEIEFVGISETACLHAVQGAGVPVGREMIGDGRDHANGTWVVKDDGSVHGRGGGGELVSPPLSGTPGLNQVKLVCQTILRAGATANRSCGLHVHVDAAGLTGRQMANVVRLYRDHQAIINHFFPGSRHRNRYARTLREDIDPSLTRLAECRTQDSIRGVVNYMDRYQAVNLAAFARHGTIEFRQHHGTTNYTKVLAWIKFCLALVQKAVSMAPESILTAATPVPARRGRPPNYEARSALWSLMANGLLDDEGTSQRIGHSLVTTRRWIRELQACGAIIEDPTATGCYRASRRISANNRALLNTWLGETNTPVASRAISHNTLFEGMPAALHRFYTARAASLGHIWT